MAVKAHPGVTLLRQAWLRALRSPSRRQETAGRVVLLLLAGVLALNLLSVGFFLGAYLAVAFPSVDPSLLVGSGLLFYFAGEECLRLLVQRTPTRSVEPYLLVPVPQSTLVHLWLLGSFFSFFNVLPLLVVVPFSVTEVVPRSGALAGVAWIAALTGMLFLNSMVQLAVRRGMLTRTWVVGLPFAVLAVAVVFEVSGIVSVSSVSATASQAVLRAPALAAVPWLLAALLYVVMFHDLRGALSAEHLELYRRSGRRQSGSLGWLGRFGETGRYMALDLKVLLRTRRGRALMALAISSVPLLVGMTFFIVRATEFYPDADAPKEVRSAPAPGHVVVTLVVRGAPVPPGATVFVAGEQAALGGWRPDAVPLALESDGSWRRTISVLAGDSLRFTFTLGSWETVRVTDRQEDVRSIRLRADHDTTVTVRVEAWKVPEVPMLVDFNLMYLVLLISLIGMLSYGQFIFGWESNYFDLLMSANVPRMTYLRAKYLLLVIAGVLATLLASPVVFLQRDLLGLFASTALYNIGINPFVLLLVSTYSRKRMDLNASIFGVQGKGASQFLVIVPTTVVPIAAFLLMRAIVPRDTAILVFAIAGVLGICLFPFLFRGIVRQFERQRYSMAAGFRQSS